MRVLPVNVSYCLGVAAIVWSLAGCQSPSGATTRPAHDTNEVATETPTPVESGVSAPRPARDRVARPRSTTKISQIEDSLRTLEAIPLTATTRNF